MSLFFVFGKVGFEPLGKFTTGKHDAASAAFALQPNIRAQTRNNPLIGTAGMLFAQAQVIVEVQVGEHTFESGVAWKEVLFSNSGGMAQKCR
jgi:hypothetical protein